MKLDMGALGRANNNINTKHNANDINETINKPDIKFDAYRLGRTKNTDMKYNAGKLSKAKNNINIDLDANGLDGTNKTIDIEHNLGSLGGADKTIDTEHNISKANNTPDGDRANNVKIKAKVCEFNLF